MVCEVQGVCLPSIIALPPSDLHFEGEHLQEVYVKPRLFVTLPRTVL